MSFFGVLRNQLMMSSPVALISNGVCAATGRCSATLRLSGIGAGWNLGRPELKAFGEAGNSSPICNELVAMTMLTYARCAMSNIKSPEIRLRSATGPACWTGAELRQRDDWVYVLDDDERAELDAVLDSLGDQDPVLLRKAAFELPRFGPRLAAIRKQVLNGTGLALVRNLPVGEDEARASRLIFGLGLHLGEAHPQDASGALLHHVRDTGANVAGRDDVRTYETREAQPWHNDGGDVFALLCRQVSSSGGASYVASAHTVFNRLLEQDPKLVETLQNDFHFDARGQQLTGQSPIQRVPVFTWHNEHLYVLHKRHYIEHAQRFPEVPRLTDEQWAAMDAFDAICDDPDVHLHFQLEPGDMEVGHNFTVLHRRGAFDDHVEGTSPRHMLRLWLGLKDGWPLPEAYRTTREFGHLFSIRQPS